MTRRLGVALALLVAVGAAAALLHAQAPARRVVSLVPAVTEMLFAIGAGDQVVGVSSFDTFPAEATTRPRVGGLMDPNYEQILALRPDLVITYGSQDELKQRLTRSRIPMFDYRHGGLGDISATVRAVGERTGRTTEAAALATRITADLEAIRTRVAGRPRPKVLLVFGREEGAMRGLFVSGGVGFLHDLVTLAGGDNVMADVKREGLQLSLEQLLTRAPEVVIELRGGEGWSAERMTRERQSWQRAQIPASRAGRVHIVTDPSLVIPGPRVANAAKVLADLLHPI
ncbi:MAG: ABC transporter substrate-binding protein [Acidobacteria bacterium]|nr:ABC transporter substrate-binding protein [Acidobacteriota bacterium]